MAVTVVNVRRDAYDVYAGRLEEWAERVIEDSSAAIRKTVEEYWRNGVGYN